MKQVTIKVPTDSLYAIRATGATVNPQETCTGEWSNHWMAPGNVSVRISGTADEVLKAVQAAEDFRNRQRY